MGLDGLQKMCESENIKTDMLINPNDVLEPINHVFNNFGDLGHFPYFSHVFSKKDLKIIFFLLFTTYIFLETWDKAWKELGGVFRIRGHLRSWEVVKGH